MRSSRRSATRIEAWFSGAIRLMMWSLFRTVNAWSMAARVLRSRSSTPLASHVFGTSGYFAPRLQVAGPTGPASTVSFNPAILTTDPVPAAAPPAPLGVRASFLGLFPADPLDPTQTAPQPAFAISVASPLGSTLLGWNVYLSQDGALWGLVTALPPDLPAGAPLRLPPWDPSRHSVRIALAALNWAAQGPLSAPLTMTFPLSGQAEGSSESGSSRRSERLLF